MTNSKMRVMSEQMSLLVEAKVLIEQVEMCYNFPRLKGWLERYEALFQEALDEEAARCTARNERKGLFRSASPSPCEGTPHSTNQSGDVKNV